MKCIVVKCVSYYKPVCSLILVIIVEVARDPPSTAIKFIFHCFGVESFRFFALPDISLVFYPICALAFEIHFEISTCVILGLSMPHILRPPLFKIYYLLEHCYLLSFYQLLPLSLIKLAD
ncbi:hypothetical protein MACJ_004123 [Theileria orientalis]|uniref:Uncharacterized protein n=1 Tax=Theileria orientalis TaxID=68886 RepID=A0A976SL88_THEOR|nr:hypothetical protein MACJ_004123 [Theileria orientalis]